MLDTFLCFNTRLGGCCGSAHLDLRLEIPTQSYTRLYTLQTRGFKWLIGIYSSVKGLHVWEHLSHGVTDLDMRVESAHQLVEELANGARVPNPVEIPL